MKKLLALFLLVSSTIAPAQSHLVNCPSGDISGDCIVDMNDLTQLAVNWLTGQNDLDMFSYIASDWHKIGSSVIVINEINYKPEVNTLALEYIELHNTASVNINISDWSFDKGVDYTFPANTYIPAGGYIVVAQDKPTLAGYYALDASVVYGPYSGKLSNDGETLRLVDNLGDIVDIVDYSVGFPWPTMALGEGSSLELVNPLVDNDLAGNWRSSGYSTGIYSGSPTPAEVNSVLISNNAPCIRQVVHEPSAPAAGEPVVVSAKVSDPEGVAWVVLKYQQVVPGSYIPATLPNYPQTQPATIANPAYDAAANWVSMNMNDLGNDGDKVAGDGVYSVTVPGTVQQHRHLLRYRIVAGDNSNKSVTVPYNDDSQRNFAWFTYNGIPGWSGAIDPYSSDTAYKTKRTFSAELMNSVPAIHLLSRNTDVMTCQYNSSYDNTSYYFSGTLIYNGRVYDNIHYHIRGQASTFVWGKNKWKIKFNPAHDFIGCDIYGNEYANGADTLNLGSGVCAWWKYPHPNGSWDKGAGGMVLNEMLAYRYYQLAGAAVSNTAFAQLRIIDNAIETSSSDQFEGDFWGLYITVEHADGSFLDEREMADGNIFRMDGGYNQTHQCATQPDDGSDINSLRYVLNNTTPTEQWWQSNFNLEHYYSTRSVGIAINDADRRVDANCIFYRDSETNLWWYIPWDLDLVFEPGGHYSPSSWENVQKALAYSQYKMEYQNRGRELVDLLFNGEQAAQLVDEIAALIYTPGSLSFVDAERARWDNCSFVASGYRKLWYKHNEFLPSEDFTGMVAYMKRAVSPAGFTAAGSAYNSLNVPALIAEVNNVSPAIAATPTISYIGQAGYPSNGLSFHCSDFSSSAGLSFAAVSWRIARVEPQGELAKGRPLFYEIKSHWQTTLTTYDTTITIPHEGLVDGGTYRVRCRMKDSAGRWSHWSAPHEFVVSVPAQAPAVEYLRVTELSYNPADPDNDELAAGYDDSKLFEFIELSNISSTETIDLSAVKIEGGINFDFADSVYTQLLPGRSILVVADEAAFNARYEAPAGECFVIAGDFDGSLSNGGETIILSYDDTEFISFTYDDSWYPETDGNGYSLEPIDSALPDQIYGSLDNSANWQASSEIGGNPQSEICN